MFSADLNRFLSTFRLKKKNPMRMQTQEHSIHFPIAISSPGNICSYMLTCSWPGIRNIHQWSRSLWHRLVMYCVGDSQWLLLRRLSKVSISEQNCWSVICKLKKKNQIMSNEFCVCQHKSFTASPQTFSAGHHQWQWQLPLLCRTEDGFEVCTTAWELWV